MTAQATATVEMFPEFAWGIPKSFSVPLGDCRFEQGDRLYNSVKGYEGTWNDALQHLDYSIEVLSPRRGEGIQKTDKDSASVFCGNWSTPVRIAITHHKENRTEELRTTQGRLYSLLWRGELSIVSPTLPDPTMPLKTITFLNEIERELAHFRACVSRKFPCAFFLTPFDETNSIFVGKANAIRDALSQEFIFELHKERPYVVYGSELTEFAPTLYLACYVINSTDTAALDAAFKKALHTPAKNKVTDRENWNLRNHGRLVVVSDKPALTLDSRTALASKPTATNEVGI